MDENIPLASNQSKKRRLNRSWDFIRKFNSENEALECMSDWGIFSLLQSWDVQEGYKKIYRKAFVNI